jgi:hypothetical protein
VDQFLNYFFFAFHTVLILFNILGWMFHKTRRWNLLTLLLTGASWFILGIWYGWGYCFCTDWHWDVRERLGYIDHSSSYIHFLVLELTGIDVPKELVDDITVAVFFFALIMSLVLNARDFRKRKLGRV